MREKLKYVFIALRLFVLSAALTAGFGGVAGCYDHDPDHDHGHWDHHDDDHDWDHH